MSTDKPTHSSTTDRAIKLHMRLEQQKDTEDKRIAVKLAQDESQQQMEGFKLGLDFVQDAIDDK